jgi:carbonic anhydrase/acetyltransferase-like protein (isoleucine patch superfamily)
VSRETSDAPSLQEIHTSAWVSPSAQLYGKITIGADCSVWHNVVARAECQEISVGRMTNIQDFVMIHVGYDHPTRIGDFCSITHHSTIHGCTIGDDCLIGINSVIMDGAVIGEGSIVAGGAMVTEGRDFPPHSIIAGVPAKVIGERDCARENRMNAWTYHYNAQATRRGEPRAWVGPEFEAWREAKRAEVERDEDLLLHGGKRAGTEGR